MSATRILLLVLTLAVVALLARYLITGSAGPGDTQQAAPARTLERVREQTRQAEDDLKKAAERADAARDSGQER